MAQISHVDNLLVQLRSLVDEAGGVAQLARDSGAGKNTIYRMLHGAPCRLGTLEKVARSRGKSIAEMFLAPGVETDWYRDAALAYLPDDLAGCAETTYIAVAEKAGVPYRVFWLYLNGSQSPMTNTLQKIADALEMEVADLFLPPDGGEADDE